MPKLETTICPSSERTTATDHSHSSYSHFWPQYPPEPLIKPRSNGNRPAVTPAHSVIGAGRPTGDTKSCRTAVARLSPGDENFSATQRHRLYNVPGKRRGSGAAVAFSRVGSSRQRRAYYCTQDHWHLLYEMENAATDKTDVFHEILLVYL